MKRTAIMFGTGLSAAILVGGIAHGHSLQDEPAAPEVPAVPDVPALPALPDVPALPVPALPDASGVVGTVEDTLAGVGVPVEVPSLPALPEADQVVDTVNQTLAGAGVEPPTTDPIMAVPENVIVGNGNELVDRLPLYLSTVPGVSEATAAAGEVIAAADGVVAATDGVVAAVEETVAGLGLPLDAGGLVPEL